jgi:hypothetical protein
MLNINIMTLEQQLLAEIKERQEKLEKLQGVSPKLQALESLLQECQVVCNEFGMQDLFTSLLGNFTVTPVPPNKTPSAPQPQNLLQPPVPTLSDKETKIIRLELKTFLDYEGQRLNDKTAKELLIKKLEEVGKQQLLAEVDLDDKDNFLTEAKKLITLAKEEDLTVAKEEDLTVAKEEDLTVAKEEDLTVAKEEDLTVAKEEDLTVAKEEDLTPTVNNPAPLEEVKEEEGLNPKDAAKSALVQNTINGFYGTVDRDGIANVENKECALVRYPQETLLTPLSELKLIQPAIIKPTPKVEEEIKEEEVVSDMTPQELGMWNALLAAGFTATELSAMATDKETLEGFNSINGSSLTALPIAELYEYTMGVGRIE